MHFLRYLLSTAALCGSCHSPRKTTAHNATGSTPHPSDSEVQPCATTKKMLFTTTGLPSQDLYHVLNPNWPVMTDHIGPDAVSAIRKRILDNPGRYIELFEDAFFETPIDAVLLGALWPQHFVNVVAEVAPERARGLMRRTVKLYQRAYACTNDEAVKLQLGRHDEVTKIEADQ